MSPALSADLGRRADGACELCGDTGPLAALPVFGGPTGAEGEVAACRRCGDQVSSPDPLDATHWFCLQTSIWSAVPAVQVLSCRIAGRLSGEPWAAELLEQVWLDAPLKAWLEATPEEEEEGFDENVVKDINGVILQNGDTVSLTKGLDVKGANFTAKQGTMVRRIRLCDVKEHILGRVNGQEIYIKGCFLKRISTAGD